MPGFEVIERDGLARLGRFDTPHGPIDTPALLPVVHPDPARQPVSPAEMRDRLGVRALITSSYIVWRTPPLRAVAEREGIHGLVHFDGAVMTDSGAFQQHAYGSVEVGPEEILEFQRKIGSDIPTVLDIFTEPESSHDEAESALATTLARAAAARKATPGLLAVPVQGGSHDDLRMRSALAASELGDVLAVGGVVPLMEQYRFVELARMLAAARPGLGAGSAVHLFGTGHPMTFAFAALFGVDLFDSSAYHKFARRGSLLFPEGTVSIDEIRDPVCRCFLCAERPLSEVADLPAPERERRMAFHNLLTSVEEIGRVRRAIRDGTLWELAERRAAGHPALRAGLAEACRWPEVFLPTEPESRRSFREVSVGSRDRPSVVRFQRRVATFAAGRPNPRRIPRIALRPEYLLHLPLQDATGTPIFWETATPLGTVPLELGDLYPVGPYLGVDEFADPRRHLPPSAVRSWIEPQLTELADLDRDWSEAWTKYQVASLIEWRYGLAVAKEIVTGLIGERSRRSGRLRAIRSEAAILFHIGTDGVPRPTYRGAERLRAVLPPGRERVTVSDDALPFVRGGRSLFSRFVVSADPALVPGSTALLVDRSDTLVAVGRLLLAPHEMPWLSRGVAVRVVAHAAAPEPPVDDPGPEADRRTL
ncbi:MAG: tRNA guanosine(15) transglycosylase TgtA [Thermoplasmata archaeon]